MTKPPTTMVVTAAAAGAATLFALRSFIRRKKRHDISGSKPLILITGCDNGFGLLLTDLALDAGFAVVAACYTKEGAEKHRSKANVTVIVADLLTKDGRRAVVEATRKACEERASSSSTSSRGLYAIVNNAGLCVPGYAEWLSPDIYQRSMELMFHAPVELTYELLPLIKKAQGGRIVNVTSVDGIITLPTNAAYNAAKHALESYSDCLRCEMSSWGVKVVVIEPATMKTPLAMSFADNFKQCFLDAPLERREQYGDNKWINTVHDVLKRGLDFAAVDPIETARDILDGLTLVNPPTRILSGFAAKFVFKPLSRLSDTTRDKILHAITMAPYPTPQGLLNPIPPPNKIAYVTIKVRSLVESVAFYEKHGFIPIGEASVDGKRFLCGAPSQHWRPKLLLWEDATMPVRKNSYELGQTRLCLYSTNVDRTVHDLEESMGLTPAYPIVSTWMAKIATYKSPDGFVVYYIQFRYVLGTAIRILNRGNLGDPNMFHWTVNVNDSQAANDKFAKIGFKAMSDQKKNQVGYDLLPAFGMDGNTTEIEHIRLARLPGDHFVVTTMEWTKPKSVPNGQELSNALALSVSNVREALERAKNAGFIVKDEEKIETMTLPFYGKVQIGRAYLEELSNPIDFVQF